MLRRAGLCLLPLCVLTIAGFGQKRAMVIDDLAKLVSVGGPQVSPDGGWVAYTTSTVDVGEDKSVSELWMVSWDGKQDVQLTFGPEAVSSPRWSPDGKWLAFTSSRPGKAKGSQVWLLDRRGGEAHQLTEVKEDIEDYRWSPDSKQMLLTLRAKEEPEPEKGAKPTPPKPIVIDRYHFKQDIQGYLSDKREHLFLFEIATKKLTRVIGDDKTEDKFEERQAEWSPDGKLIAFVSNQEAPDPDRSNNSDVFVVEAKGNSVPKKLTSFSGVDAGPLAWSPDSSLIVYRQGVSPRYSIYDMERLAVVPAGGGAPEVLPATAEMLTGAPVFAQGGKALLTTIAEDRVEYLAEVPLKGKDVTRLTAEKGSASTIAAADRHVAVVWTTDLVAPEIYALDGTSGSKTLRKLTGHNDALMAQLALAPAEDLSAKAEDGNEVHSLLTMPFGYVAGTKAPMLLWIHGGPTSQDSHRFAPDRQLFAAHGFAVLQVNYRGSTGRGHDYSVAINADWGDKEVKDLLAAVDGAVASGKIDAERMGVGGWSYGGILTDYTIASTTRFKAASSGAGTANLLGMYGVDQYILQYDNELQPPWKNVEPYLKLSYPFLHADKIVTPTLFMGGDKDFNVTLVGGEQMYQALKSVGTTAELVVYPGQFHGFTRPSFVRDRYQRWFAWYDKYLGMPVVKPAVAAPVVKAE
ncbi:S9 family peptidase [Tunturiibacter lichenicola]|uniref:S9 family peptidase n=1 Tax=Tunturiibacter lichenicola TaxID=2051959 RepID=UPI0021B277EF|nr:S9 family peptidase [Edaphobacter lichenicola]